MEKRSTNTLDVNTWIKKVISSCETIRQLNTARQLKINFLRSLYTDKSTDRELYRLVDNDLTVTYNTKFRELFDGQSK
jgi:hypothetical protein